VVRAELKLEAVNRLHRWARHDAGVVDHDVQRRMACEEAVGEGADLLKRAELQLRHLDIRVAGRLPDARSDCFTLRQVAGGEDHVRAPLGERARRFLADPARPAGDQRHLASQVDPFAHLARRGVGAERRRVAHGRPFLSSPGAYHVGRKRETASTCREPTRPTPAQGRRRRRSPSRAGSSNHPTRGSPVAADPLPGIVDPDRLVRLGHDARQPAMHRCAPKRQGGIT
jgi:hypothetical protein